MREEDRRKVPLDTVLTGFQSARNRFIEKQGPVNTYEEWKRDRSKKKGMKRKADDGDTGLDSLNPEQELAPMEKNLDNGLRQNMAVMEKEQENVIKGSIEQTDSLYKSGIIIKKRKLKINETNCSSLKVGVNQQDTGAQDTVGAGVGGGVRDGGAVSSLGLQQSAGVEKFRVSTVVQSATATLGRKPVLGESTK